MPTAPTPVQLYRIDYRTAERAFFSPPHRHPVAEIFFFVAGEGTHYIDFTAHPIRANAVFLVAPQQVHYIEAPAHSHNVGYVVSFDTALLDVLDPGLRSLFGSFTQPPAYQLPDGPATLLRLALAQLADELGADLPRSGSVAKLIIDLLLTYTFRAGASVPLPDARPSMAEAQFAQLMTGIEADYERPRSVQRYADRLNITPRQLNRICRQVRGQSALTVIHQRIALEAKRLLFYSAEPVKEIAYRLGFKDPAHFTHFFRREAGLAPESFRAQMAQIRK
ncbi:MAG: helix-turn-helix domain-containing protein [Ferruginibacter sp.]|nr:helix-turn-helix domain-containing protein [Cytophagales bacterium]